MLCAWVGKKPPDWGLFEENRATGGLSNRTVVMDTFIARDVCSAVDSSSFDYGVT